MSIKLKTTSNGSVSLTPEDTASDVVLTVPATAGVVVNDATLRTELNASGSAPIYACRAWVNFDGTTTPPTIRASGNVSSVTRTATGNFDLNFTTAMSDANYAITGAKDNNSASAASEIRIPIALQTTTSARILTAQSTSPFSYNENNVNIAIFR